MNRDEFVLFRKSVLEQEAPLLLDEMNPFAAMAGLKENFAAQAARTHNDVLDLLAKYMAIDTKRGDMCAAKGVRASLETIFNICAAQGRELWLPEDVYPFYWQAAEKESLQPRSFQTLPAPDLSFLEETSDNSTILISNPLTPLGQLLSDEDTTRLKKWLAGAQNRRLVIDTVYTYSGTFDKNTCRLYETGQTIIAHSLSKAWLERGRFGIVIAPQADHEILRRQLETPNQETCAAVYNTLEHQPDLPARQTRWFKQEWARITPHIRRFDPAFQPPQSGYFALTHARYDNVLAKHKTLIIPASVFGSTQDNLSIVSCLRNTGP